MDEHTFFRANYTNSQKIEDLLIFLRVTFLWQEETPNQEKRTGM
jgi:hypothetical protein